MSQIARHCHLSNHVTRKLMIKLIDKKIVRVRFIQREGGFFDNRPLELHSAVTGFSPGGPDKLYAQAVFDKHLSGHTVNFISWMKQKFGLKRSRTLLIKSGIYGKHAKSTTG